MLVLGVLLIVSITINIFQIFVIFKKNSIYKHCQETTIAMLNKIKLKKDLLG